MSYSFEGTDVVIKGFESGISQDPYSGLADIRNANLISVPGEASVNFSTTAVTPPKITAASVTVDAASDTVTYSGSPSVHNGMAFTVGSTANGLTAGTTYWAGQTSGSTFKVFTDFASAVNSGTYGGTAVDITSNGSNTITSIIPTAATYTTYDPSNPDMKYYFVDSSGRAWGYMQNGSLNKWIFLGNSISESNNGNGIQAYHGWLFVFNDRNVSYMATNWYWNPLTTNQVRTWTIDWLYLNTPSGTHNPHASLNGYDDTVYYTDATFIGSFYAVGDFSLMNMVSSDAAGDTITVTLNYGAFPVVGTPVIFSGTNVATSGLTPDSVYYVITATTTAGGATIQVSTTKGGAAFNITGNGSGVARNFSPVAGTSGDVVVNTQALALPSNEIAQCVAELGQDLLIGALTNRLYPWNRVDNTFNIPILIAENNIQKLLTVNTNTFIFAGNRGRIYYTNGSQAQLYFKVPDYVTGAIEPYFTWQAVGYNRNQLYFSFSNTSNSGSTLTTTGGLWAIDVDSKIFRLSNILSYGTYAGYATLYIGTQEITTTGNGFGFQVGWYDGTNYGIDATSSTPYSNYETYIDSDIIPVGTFYKQKTFTQVEFKLSTPLVSGEGVKVYYRTNLSASFSQLGTWEFTTVGPISDARSVDFQKVQWIQFRIYTKSTASTPSYTRLREMRVR